VSSFEPSQGADQTQACEEIARCFFVAGRDASELFEESKETFDQIAFSVEGEVAIASDLAVRLWRDDRLDGSHFEALDEGVGVVALVAEEGFGLHFSREGFSLGDIVDLAAGEAERQRVAQGVDDHMDLGGQAAARAAYGLVDAPFLRAPALC
jgi:hypothetical protein